MSDVWTPTLTRLPGMGEINACGLEGGALLIGRSAKQIHEFREILNLDPHEYAAYIPFGEFRAKNYARIIILGLNPTDNPREWAIISDLAQKYWISKISRVHYIPLIEVRPFESLRCPPLSSSTIADDLPPAGSGFPVPNFDDEDAPF